MLILLAAITAFPHELDGPLSPWIADDQQRTLLEAHVDEAIAASAARLSILGPTEGLKPAIYAQITQRLSGLAEAKLTLTPEAIERTVLDYEVWKAETYVTSGVFPKRYFGYVDGLGDTAAWEAKLQRTTRKAVASLNLWSEAEGSKLRVTEAEVIVTFLAEGGALALTTQKEQLRGLHPVFDVGLDHVALGMRDLPKLRERLDRDVGTDLGTLVGWAPSADAVQPYTFEAHATSWVPTAPPPGQSALAGWELWLLHDQGEAGPYPYLRRKMSFDEAIAGTAVMLLWEKQIAEQKLEASGLAPLWTRPLDEQLIISSLVYNSGLLHSKRRWDVIRSFTAGVWMAEASEQNATRRPRLELSAPPAQLAELIATKAYREQWTSWLSGYHVLQRYGAFVGLMRFTDTFDERGRVSELLAEPLPSALEAELPHR